MTDQLPVPSFFIEMNYCNCKNTKCLSRRSCAKSRLRCTDLCKFIGCENEEMIFTAVDNEYSKLDEDDYDGDDVESSDNLYSEIEVHILHIIQV